MSKSERKIFLFGRYSLALLLPKKWLRDFKVKRGDILNLELDKKQARIIVRLKNTRNEKTSRKKKKVDWEPIPQL